MKPDTQTLPHASQLSTSEREAVYDELAVLLAQPFPLELGMIRQGRNFAVYGSPQGEPEAATRDLSVSILSRRKPAPQTIDWTSAQKQEEENKSFERCRELLTDPNVGVRAGACRRLGEGRRKEAASALHDVAVRDKDPHVRSLAQEAFDLLEVPLLPRHAVSGLTLSLFVKGQEGRYEFATARTSERGHTVFKGVPADADCQLEVVQPEPIFEFRGRHVHRTSTGEGKILFSERSKGAGASGGWELYVSTVPKTNSANFDAELHFIGPHPAWESRPDRVGSIPMVLALLKRGCQIFQPIEFDPLSRRAVFGELPNGRYEVVLHEPPRHSVRRTALFARDKEDDSNGSLAAIAETMIVHPSDRRLLAAVDADENHRVVITVETRAPELANRDILVRLHDESVKLKLEAVSGTDRIRAETYLHQPIAADSAIALTIELV